MISKKAIQNFLINRKLNSFEWLKSYNHRALDAALRLLKPTPKFGTIKPWLHQKAVFLILNEIRRFLVFVDMGGGKTLLMLMLLMYRKQCGEKVKAIVFVPYITSVSTWIDEVKAHAPSLRCVPLLGTTGQNLRRLSGEGDLFVICYQSAVAMVTSKEGKKGKWKLEAKQVREYFADFSVIIMDEIHKCKKVKSLTYRMCRAISSQADWAVGLTGTPFGRNPEELWPQFHLADFGETLGPTLEFYRAVFFKEKKNQYTGFTDYNFDRKKLPDLKRIIKHRSISYDINDLHDLPPKLYIPKYLPLPDESKGYCEDAVARLKEAAKKGAYQEVENNYLRLRQLASGFLTLKSENNSRLQLKFEDNPKLDALSDLVDSMPVGRKIVIFHHFIYTNQLISDRLREMKVRHARVWSGQKDPIGQLRTFKEDPDCAALVINSKSGSSSLNLQFANYVCFFEQPDDPIDRQQAERRCWRPGQGRRVFIHDLLMKDTMDIRIWKSNKAGENLLKQLLRGL